VSIRVVAVEDDSRYRESLEVLFRHADDFSLVTTFSSSDAVLAALDAALAHDGAPGWDLVLMDLDLPGLTGIECIQRIKQRLPAATVVVLTVFEDRANILQAICAGADGYLLKRTPADRLLTQLRAVLAGGSPLSVSVARTVLELVRNGHAPAGATTDAAAGGLTERELEVLGCLARGLSYKRTATQLGISIDTVRTRVRGIYHKLQVHSVAQAVGHAIRTGIV
jgi:DNA-binding NarL/FixJ family response regulator